MQHTYQLFLDMQQLPHVYPARQLNEALLALSIPVLCVTAVEQPALYVTRWKKLERL